MTDAEEKRELSENKRNARATLKDMHITDMRVFAESMDRDTTGLTTGQVKALLMKMAHDFDWMPDPPPAAQPAQEQGPVLGTKTWFEDGKIVTQNLYHSDIYTTPPAAAKEKNT
jgi:hypothetical protein